MQQSVRQQILVSVLSILSFGLSDCPRGRTLQQVALVFRSKSLCSCAGLAGALFAVVEETDKSDSLNKAGMKKLTGIDVITAWPLFRDYITFTATVLVSLMNVRSLCQGISS
jgi:hypothetical protein